MGMDGHQLRVMRTQLGYTQVELAYILGLTQNTISRWESGSVAIRHPIVLGLALERLMQIKQERIREDLGDAVSGVGAECVAGGEA
jgi:transcriptional regulator with XRE-family HTH domain